MADATATSPQHSVEQQNTAKPPSVLFSTYELIELIMLQMTTFDITVAMRVCKFWREVLESSKALKEYLSTLHIAPMRKTRPTKKYGKTHHLVVARGGRGRFVLTLLDGEETTIFVPHAKGEKLHLLDQRYTRTVVHDEGSDKTGIEWHDDGGTLVCRLDARGHGKFYETLMQIYGCEPRALEEPKAVSRRPVKRLRAPLNTVAPLPTPIGLHTYRITPFSPLPRISGLSLWGRNRSGNSGGDGNAL